MVFQALAQETPPSPPPLPPPVPQLPPRSRLPMIRPAQIHAAGQARPGVQTNLTSPVFQSGPLFSQPVLSGVPTQPAQHPIAVTPPQPVVGMLPPSSLAWDSESKDYEAKPGEGTANFTFYLTNVATAEVLINSVRTSCGCTVAQLPQQPWHIGPGTNGPIKVTVNLAGKSGTIVKTVTVDSTAGVKSLLVKVNIPTPTPIQPALVNASNVDRTRNMQLALADRQAALKNDCAKCHVEPAVGKMGKELYAGACSICHNAEHRASMVPDLQNLNKPTSPEYWKQFIADGSKPGTLMPAFAKEHGGFFTEEQVTSLVDYLVKDFPKEAKIVYHEPVIPQAKPVIQTNSPSAALPKSVQIPAASVSVFPINASK
jgi:mono/diheme cytochrome c family protein